MTLLDWSNALELGIDLIDSQHKVLLDIMNDLNAQILRGKGKKGCDEALERMHEYTESHFRDEEELMRKSGFPGLKGHKMVHAKFAQRVWEFSQTDVVGDQEKSLEVLLLLQNWLVDHILGPDMLFAHHYKTLNKD